MRFTIFQVLSVLLVVALALALFVNQQRSQRQIDAFRENADAQERLEDALERSVIEKLTPGDRLDSDPYYRLLVDRIVTNEDPDFTGYSSFISENFDDAPLAFDNCEFHEFSYLEDYATECHYVVVTREGRCVLVVLAGISLRPA